MNLIPKPRRVATSVTDILKPLNAARSKAAADLTAFRERRKADADALLAQASALRERASAADADATAAEQAAAELETPQAA